MVVTLGQQYNVGEKSTVILYTYIIDCIRLRRSSGLVGNLHTCQCGSREFDSYQNRICVLSFVTENVGT